MGWKSYSRRKERGSYSIWCTHNCSTLVKQSGVLTYAPVQHNENKVEHIFPMDHTGWWTCHSEMDWVYLITMVIYISYLVCSNGTNLSTVKHRQDLFKWCNATSVGKWCSFTTRIRVFRVQKKDELKWLLIIKSMYPTVSTINKPPGGCCFYFGHY